MDLAAPIVHRSARDAGRGIFAALRPRIAPCWWTIPGFRGRSERETSRSRVTRLILQDCHRLSNRRVRAFCRASKLVQVASEREAPTHRLTRSRAIVLSPLDGVASDCVEPRVPRFRGSTHTTVARSRGRDRRRQLRTICAWASASTLCGRDVTTHERLDADAHCADGAHWRRAVLPRDLATVCALIRRNSRHSRSTQSTPHRQGETGRRARSCEDGEVGGLALARTCTSNWKRGRKRERT
jgi:hypothetical protein